MFLVCGEALYDVFIGAETGEGRLALSGVVGGSPLNVAIGLARQGHAVGFLAGVSTDALGDRLARHVATEGVATQYLRRKTAPTTLSLVGLGAGGAPAYTFYGHRAADVALTQDDLPALGAEVIGLHVGSYATVVEPAATTLAQLVRRESHRLVAYDPNVRPTIEPDAEVWRRHLAETLPHVAVIKASEEDLAILCPGEAIGDVAHRWLAAGPALVIVTRGSAGAFALTQAGEIATPARAVAVVDTVGAGDAFQAALIAGLIDRGARRRDDVAALTLQQIETIMARCCSAAAIVCSRRGADLPRRAELD
jgi:fructokinase